MSKVTWEQLKNIIIAIGLFVPLFSYIHHLLQSYGGGMSVLNLTSVEQLSLLVLILAPLIILRLFNIQGCLPDSILAKLKFTAHKHNTSRH